MDGPRSDDIFYRNDHKEYPYLVLKIPAMDSYNDMVQVALFSPFFNLTGRSDIIVDIKQVTVVDRSTVMRSMTYSQVQELDDVYKRAIRKYKLNMIRLTLLTKLNLKSK